MLSDAKLKYLKKPSSERLVHTDSTSATRCARVRVVVSTGASGSRQASIRWWRPDRRPTHAGTRATMASPQR